MEVQESDMLKKNVRHKQIARTKDALEEEIESIKKKTLELRKSLDQVKSKEAIKALIYKRQREDLKKNLHESQISWSSDLQRIFNSLEHFKTSQLQKSYFLEKSLNQLMEILSPMKILQSFGENSTEVYEPSQTLKNGEEKSLLETFYSSLSSPLNMTTLKALETIREKIQNQLSPVEKVHFFQGLSSVDENIEISFEGNSLSPHLQSRELRDNGDCQEVFSDDSRIEQIHQDEESSIDFGEGKQSFEKNPCIEGFGVVTTVGDQGLLKKNVETTYIVNESELKEDTLNYTKAEISFRPRSWKYLICPCIYRKINP